jgi:nucleoside-diphosphate-sugar epimerase
MGKSKEIRNVLITGSAGYIGINLCNYLTERGVFVFPFDKDSCFSRRCENLEKIGANIDIIVHLAAFPGIVNCMNDFDRAVIDNISTAFNVFKLAGKIPVIFTSSQAAKQPYDNLYASIKRMIEVEADRLNRLGSDIRVFRLSNVYGGYGYLTMKDTVVKKFIVAKQNNHEMIINGTGDQIRDFIHVDDVCEAIYLCMLRENGFKKPVDIGTGVGTSILDLAKMLDNKFTFDEKSDIIGSKESIANIERAYRLFGFKYKYNLENYLKGF